MDKNQSICLSNNSIIFIQHTNFPVTNDAIIILQSSPPLIIKLFPKDDVTQSTEPECSLNRKKMLKRIKHFLSK